MVIQLGHQILNAKSCLVYSKTQTNISRDFIYIDDVIQSNIKACAIQNINGTYNVLAQEFQETFKTLLIFSKKNLDTNLGTEYFPNPYNDYQLHTQADIIIL